MDNVEVLKEGDYPLHLYLTSRPYQGNRSQHAPSKISQTFRDFYQSLYNISPAGSSSPLSTFVDAKTSYIRETALPTLDEDTVAKLEVPLSEDKVTSAIAATPSGKRLYRGLSISSNN